MSSAVLRSLLLLSLLLGLPLGLQAATFYASPGGSGGCSTNPNAPSSLPTAGLPAPTNLRVLSVTNP